MLYLRCYLLGLCTLMCQTAVSADNRVGAHAQTLKIAGDQVRRNYRDTSSYLISSHALVLEGSPQHIMRMSRWLDDIIVIPIGRQTLEAIFDSGNQLIIRHSEWALHSRPFDNSGPVQMTAR